MLMITGRNAAFTSLIILVMILDLSRGSWLGIGTDETTTKGNEAYQNLCKKCHCPKSTLKDPSKSVDAASIDGSTEHDEAAAEARRNSNVTVNELTLPKEASESEIDCSKVGIEESDLGIVFPDVITKAIFAFNKIASLTDDRFTGGKNLRSLDLSHNNLKSLLSSDFKSFSSLLTLNLCNNEIFSISDDAFEGLGQLEELNLCANSISSLEPIVFKPLRRLTKLILDHNRLGALVDTQFTELPRVRYLYLSYNGLATLGPEQFKDNYELSDIRLTGNDFHKVPTEGLQSASGLLTLDISQNPIEVLGYYDFVGLKNLTSLRMDGMRNLRSIGPYTFMDCEHLDRLYCNNNPLLEEISEQAFYNNQTKSWCPLQTLELRQNKLQTLGARTLTWKNLTQVDLAWNPWLCDCNLKWVAQINFPREDSQDTVCDKPSRLSGRSIRSLKEKDFTCPYLFQGELMIASVLLFILILFSSLSMIAFVFMRCSWWSKIKLPLSNLSNLRNSPNGILSGHQNVAYMRVGPTKDRVDLELGHDQEGETHGGIHEYHDHELETSDPKARLKEPDEPSTSLA